MGTPSFRRQKAWTVIELIVVVGIVACLLTIGFFNYVTALKGREFDAMMDQMESMIKKAQEDAKIYGKTPTIPASPSSCGTIVGSAYQDNKGEIIIKGINKQSESYVFKNSKLDFEHFYQGGITPGDVTTGNFQGVALVFSSNPTADAYDAIMFFGPNGLPMFKVDSEDGTSFTATGYLDSNNLPDPDYQCFIQITYDGGKRQGRIYIDKETGAVSQKRPPY